MRFFSISKIILGGALLLIFYGLSLFFAPRSFPVGTVFRVLPNESGFSVAERLYGEHIISSPQLFKSLIIFTAYDRTIQPGPYTFDSRENIFSIARRLGLGIFKTDFVKVTFPEGITTSQMATILEKHIRSFSSEAFISYAQGSEGYLFPDTYYFDPEATAPAIVEQLKNTFSVRTKTILKNEKNVKNVIILASILEKEGKGITEQKMIAGILNNRLERGMLLQVDAPFMFLLGKESKDLTVKDLKLDNPYNTYVYKGLPPGPIGNPGLGAIEAALSPTVNDYLFYLHDTNGNIHYAKTFAEHVKNKAQYLQ